MSEGNGKLVTRQYKLGGMRAEDSQEEVAWVMARIDGVTSAEVNNGNILNLTYDENALQEEHLKSTLYSLGHSILEEKEL